MVTVYADCVLVVISQIDHKSMLGYHILAMKWNLCYSLWQPLES